MYTCFVRVFTRALSEPPELTASNHREIHLSDLIRAHEGNPDFHDEDPNKIHWAKFNMMGRFIDAITQCQAGCRETGSFDFEPRTLVRQQLLLDHPQYLMDEEVGACHFTFLLSMYAHVCTRSYNVLERPCPILRILTTHSDLVSLGHSLGTIHLMQRTVLS